MVRSKVKNSIALCLILASGLSASWSGAATVDSNTQGLVDDLKKKGFSCASREDGSICTISSVNSRKFSYSEPIAILVPKNVQQPSKILLHLHGFRGVCESNDISAAGMADEFNFLQQMKEAGASNSVMILPMSTGKESTYKSELVPQFSEFTNWVKSEVHPSSDRWIVSGHSGAGSSIVVAMAQNPTFTKKVDSVFLLDAAYGMPGHIDQWQKIADSNPKLKISSVYATNGPQQGSVQLKNGLDSGRVSISRAEGKRHCQVPTKDYGGLLRESLGSEQAPPMPMAAAAPIRLQPAIQPLPVSPKPPQPQVQAPVVTPQAPQVVQQAPQAQPAPIAWPTSTYGIGVLMDDDPPSPRTKRTQGVR